jgi:hypothetical protein
MIKFESNAHWYTREGEASHDSDLRDARKSLMYPSVTTVDKDVFKNDFLDRWKMNQLVIAAAGYPRQLHESEESYANRIYELSMDKAKTAANFGKEVHDAIEHFPQLPLNSSLIPWINKFGTWFDSYVESIINREGVLVDHDLGVAGRYDTVALRKRDGRTIVLHYPTQDVKKNDKGKKKPVFYESWPRQLSFYSVVHAKKQGTFPADIPDCVSVIIDSNEPDDPFVKEWTKEEIIDSYHTFTVGAWLWFRKRNFWPQPNGPFHCHPTIALPT